MKKIGIAGTIAAGKTTVSYLLKRMGFVIFNSDQYAKMTTFPGKPAYQEIIDTFGEDILDQNKEIDRAKLASIIFEDEEKRQALNAIVHPKVKEGLLQFFERNQEQALVFAEVPLLFEVGWQDLFDETWVITCKKEVAIERMMEDRAYTKEEAFARYESQMENDRQIELADVVIYNDTTIADLNQKVNAEIRRLRMEVRNGIKE